MFIIYAMHTFVRVLQHIYVIEYIKKGKKKERLKSKQLKH